MKRGILGYHVQFIEIKYYSMDIAIIQIHVFYVHDPNFLILGHVFAMKCIHTNISAYEYSTKIVDF